MKYEASTIKCFVRYATKNTQKGTSVKRQTVLLILLLPVSLVQQTLVHGFLLSIYYSFNMRFTAFLNSLVLPETSSLTANIV